MGDRGRSHMTGVAHPDEFIDAEAILSLQNRLTVIESGDDEVPENPILTGAPQPQTPYLITSRIDADGRVYPTVGLTSVAATTRKVWLTHRKVKNNGTYGPDIDQPFKVTDGQRAAGTMEIELDPLPPNKTFHLVRIEAKLTSADTDDGGNRAKNPPNDSQIPTLPSQGTQLASFSTGTAQTGNPVPNEIMNGKFKYSRAAWGATDDDGAASLANALAKWRRGDGTNTGGIGSRDITDSTSDPNNWQRAGTLSRTLRLTSSDPNFDPCARLERQPFDPGEPFCVEFALHFRGVLGTPELLMNFHVYLEDSVAGRIATSTYTQILGGVTPNVWTPVRMPETTVSSLYSPSSSGKQWVRFHLGTTLSTGSAIYIRMVRAGSAYGAYAPHPKDRTTPTSDPDTPQGTLSVTGTVGYGRNGGEATAGQIIRASTD